LVWLEEEGVEGEGGVVGEAGEVGVESGVDC